LKTASFDFSAMRHFWRVFESLQADSEPTQGQWDALFQTPGYLALTASEYRRERFVDTFRLAFKPSLAAERQMALVEGPSEFLEHCLRIAEKAPVLKEQELRLAGVEQDLLDEAVSRSLEYLPLEQVTELDDVAFVIFQNHGARGYSPVVLDLLCASDCHLQGILPLTLAHEYHHNLRRRHFLEIDSSDVGEEGQELLWILHSVQREGIADLIDLQVYLGELEMGRLSDGMRSAVEQLAEAIEQAPDFLSQLDDTLACMAAGTIDIASAGKLLKPKIPFSGHPVGYYMAKAILERVGKEEMVAEVGNPISFLRLYDRASRSGPTTEVRKLYTFSPEAITALRSLEKLWTGKAASGRP